MSQCKISVDYGAAFDILAIFNVKINLCIGPKKDQSIYNFRQLSREISNQIGDYLFNKIMGSDEYKELYAVNLLTFNKVAEAQKSTGLAKEVDDANFSRFTKKNELQKKFFGTEVSEVKV